MTPRPGRLDEQYFRDCGKAVLWMIVFIVVVCAVFNGIYLLVTGGPPNG